jgi:hypothetical protein
VLAVFQVQQGPHLWIAAQYNIATFATITAIWTATWIHFGTVKMPATCATFATAAEYFYVIYEIRIGHGKLQRYEHNI